MSNHQATMAKRNRERAQKERQDAKRARKADRTDLTDARAAARAQGIDPDLVGLTTGPQALPAEA